jgi:hypothetical protein
VDAEDVGAGFDAVVELGLRGEGGRGEAGGLRWRRELNFPVYPSRS